jgi:hypothetical protein
LGAPASADKGTFGKTLAQKGLQKVSRNTGNAWKGLTLKSTSLTDERGELEDLMRADQ